MVKPNDEKIEIAEMKIHSFKLSLDPKPSPFHMYFTFY